MGEIMLTKIFSLIKKFIIGILFIYAYNVIVYPINTTIPMNVFTIVLVSFFGLPAIIGLCIFSLFVL